MDSRVANELEGLVSIQRKTNRALLAELTEMQNARQERYKRQSHTGKIIFALFICALLHFLFIR